MSHYHQLFIQVCHNYCSCITRSLVLKEAVNIEEISRVLAVERRTQLAAIQVWQ